MKIENNTICMVVGYVEVSSPFWKDSKLGNPRNLRGHLVQAYEIDGGIAFKYTQQGEPIIKDGIEIKQSKVLPIDTQNLINSLRSIYIKSRPISERLNPFTKIAIPLEQLTREYNHYLQMIYKK